MRVLDHKIASKGIASWPELRQVFELFVGERDRMLNGPLYPWKIGSGQWLASRPLPLFIFSIITILRIFRRVTPYGTPYRGVVREQRQSR